MIRSLVEQHKVHLEASNQLKERASKSLELGGAAEFLVSAKELMSEAKEVARGAQVQRPEPGYESMDHLVVNTEDVEVLLAQMDFGVNDDDVETEEDE